MLGKYIAIFSTLNLSTQGSVDLRGARKVYWGCRANYEMIESNLNHTSRMHKLMNVKTWKHESKNIKFYTRKIKHVK